MLVKVEYLKDHGTAKKGDTREMFQSTANVLEKAKIVKIAGKAKADKE
jgi:hypothetical protein